MKNTKLSIGLIACLLSVGGLAGCSKVRSSDDGVLLTYTVDGQEHKITADEILEKSFDDSSKYQSIFDIIYSVLVKNYFNHEYEIDYYGSKRSIGKSQMGDPDDVAHGSEGTIYGKANQKVDDDIDTAHTNADENNTKYKKELETILDSHGVKTVEELKDKYIEEIQKETFEKNFYTYFTEDLKLGAGQTTAWGKEADTSLRGFWSGYFADQLPYHVSHILIKLEDGSETNYADGTINEDNAKTLYNLVKTLGDSDPERSGTFSAIAKSFSDDENSAAEYGDLGIMDTSTTFVNEFKLGVYAYENYYGKDTAEAQKEGSHINAKDFATDYSAAVGTSFEADEVIDTVPVISKDVFAWLNSAAEEESDSKDATVLDDNAAFYPRNIIYNKYLNRHSVAFITGDAGDEADDTNEKVTHGYHTYNDGSKLAGVGKPILSAKVAGEWRPILCVRAGGSNYHGIHFIVVNRSPFEKGVDKNGVSQSEYYTTFYPEQDKLYPYKDGEPKKTYVNFAKDDTASTKKRAEDLASKLKSFDSDRLSKYIFLKYLAEENVVIKETKLRESLMKWIETSVLKAQEERDENWSKTWHDYIDTLKRQGSERSKLVPQACRLAYKEANSTATGEETVYVWSLIKDESDAVKTAVKNDMVALGWAVDADDAQTKLAALKVKDAFKVKGGLCNDGKNHN